jgi:mevalonate kinase
MGEYLALDGGPALLASLEPRFQLKVSKKTLLKNSVQTEFEPLANISPLSPAGIFYQNKYKALSRFQFEFKDPHSGNGGWGASSAQFALLAAFYYGQSTIQTEAQWNLDLHQIDGDYLKITRQNTAGLPPSGMDVMAQLRGGLVYLDRNKGRLDNLIWPFNDLGFIMFASGTKVATHTHLQTLHSSEFGELPFESLREAAQKFMSAFQEVQSENMVSALNEFREILKKNYLEAESTSQWIERVKAIDGVMAVKGCGALGADVILVLTCKKAEVEIVNKLKILGVNHVITKDDLTGPLHIEHQSIERTAHV